MFARKNKTGDERDCNADPQLLFASLMEEPTATVTAVVIVLIAGSQRGPSDCSERDRNQAIKMDCQTSS